MQGFGQISEVWAYSNSNTIYKDTIVFDRSTGKKIYSFADNLDESEKRFYLENSDLVRVLE